MLKYAAGRFRRFPFPVMTMNESMTPENFEHAYELLAQALDRAGPDRERLFLARLALALAHRMPDLDVFRQAVAIAESDLDAQGKGSGS